MHGYHNSKIAELYLKFFSPELTWNFRPWSSMPVMENSSMLFSSCRLRFVISENSKQIIDYFPTLLFILINNRQKIDYSNSLSNATLSNAILESTLIPFSLKNIWSTLFFLHFLWGTLIFSPLNQRCSRKNQRCSNFPDQKIFPWAMLIFPWTTLIWST